MNLARLFIPAALMLLHPELRTAVAGGGGGTRPGLR